MKNGINQRTLLLRLTLSILSVFLLIGTANAMQFDLGQDANLDLDITVSYGTGIRVSDRDDDLLTDIGTDDANRNFDQWDFVNNKLTVLGDIDLSYKNAGLFVRPKAFYDLVYMTDNANDSPDTNNAYQGGLIDSPDEWADEVEDVHGMNAELLDLFGYLNTHLWDLDIDLRVGRQVISWGESLYLAGGISSAQNPIDAAVATAVVKEVKEILMPTGAAFLNVGITTNFSLSGYYQWEWEKSKLMEGGTFFSRSDMLDEIKAPLLAQVGTSIITIPRTDDNEARDDGQFGLRLMCLLPWIEGSEVGAYYINYHDKSPLFLMKGSTYYLDYTEDIQLYGVSFSSIVGDTNVSGEFSYRQDVGFQGADEIGRPVVEMGDYWQAQTSAIHTMPLRFFAESLTITGEVGCGKQVGLSEDNDFFWTYSGNLNFGWYRVLPSLDIALNLSNSDTMEGGAEGHAAFGVGVDFTYKTVFKGSLTYANRYNRNPIKDRDTLALKLSYTF